MSTEALAVPTQSMAKYATDDAFNALAKSNDFLPRFALYGSNSNACKKAQIGIGHYGYTEGDNIIDCGAEVRCYVVSLRLKAMRITNDKVEAYFNPDHPEFKRIKAESNIKDTGALCGPEFLLWLPEQKVFVTFFMANKTMRREAPIVRSYMPSAESPNAKPMTLKVQLIEKGTYLWHGPIVTGCSIPLAAPDPETLVTELEKFNNPPEPKDEAAGASEKQATGRAR